MNDLHMYKGVVVVDMMKVSRYGKYTLCSGKMGRRD